MKRCVHLIAALLLCLTLGLHWAALQSVAWTTMVIERTCSTSFRSAVVTTFDGQHPCKLCEVVQAGKSAGETTKAPFKQPKLEMFSVPTLSWFAGIQEGVELRIPPATEPVSHTEVPPLPPPRLA